MERAEHPPFSLCYWRDILLKNALQDRRSDNGRRTGQIITAGVEAAVSAGLLLQIHQQGQSEKHGSDS
jgi:hypothetical protein